LRRLRQRRGTGERGVADTIAASASRRGFAARDMTLEVMGTCADCRRA
jgi:Fur family zinc uptake transcriptional regulator